MSRSRASLITIVGEKYLTKNHEDDEWSYKKALNKAGFDFDKIKIKHSSGKGYYDNLDIRFVKDDISILIETKDDFTSAKNKDAEKQLSAYVEYEKKLTGNKIIAILANTNDDRIKVWRGAVSKSDYISEETKLRSIDEYVDFYQPKINDKEKVMQNTYQLNELLHAYSIPEKLRSQFVGTCLLALKKGLYYDDAKITSNQLRNGIKDKLVELLDDTNKSAERTFKIGLLYKNVLEDQNIRDLEPESFRAILNYIETEILPFINDKSTAGQDLLNLFFITFNKYVHREDKNQAFTPDHITDFMTKVSNVNYKSRVLDPCCGSGSFLVRAMTTELDDCPTAKDQQKVRLNQIYGIEYSENIFGLATTNMLIHGDGNSNIICANCFDSKKWIVETAKPNVILMNPPYNASRANMPKSYVDTWKGKRKNGKEMPKKEDPSKGLYFVKYMSDCIKEMETTAVLAVLLPVQCAIGTTKKKSDETSDSDSEISKLKKEILEENTLDAVFTLPNEVFYPGASASACCMLFHLGIPHKKTNQPTFFGYYKEDGFKKKKYLGRVEQKDAKTNESRWRKIEKEWVSLYKERKAKDGMSAVEFVDGNDEWLCEAYMKTDYSKLEIENFQTTLNDYISFLIKDGAVLD